VDVSKELVAVAFCVLRTDYREGIDPLRSQEPARELNYPPGELGKVVQLGEAILAKTSEWSVSGFIRR